jgi:hypothetical protein
MTEAHVINVKERTDRWEAVQAAWKDTSLTLNRRDAIKPDGVEVRNIYDAVFLKHREILTTASKLGETHVLIMEDDAVPCKDFDERWGILREYLDARDDWEIFNGGMLSIRDCLHKIVRLTHVNGLMPPTMCLSVVRGAMAHFVYFKVEPALKRIAEWEADGRPEFDGWYSHKLKCVASIPFLAIQADGHSDASGEHRTWADRFAFEQDAMLYSLREFIKDKKEDVTE